MVGDDIEAVARQRNQSRLKKAIAIGAMVLALTAAWYFGSPRWTLYQMGKAGEARDSNKLASYIDFPVMRESMKEQVRAKMMAEMSKEQDNGFAAFGAMLGLAMIDPAIDAMLTPEMLSTTFSKEAPKGEATAAARRPFGVNRQDSRVVQMGLDEFRLRSKTAKGEEGDLIFRRHGLGWKLSGVRLPEDLAPKPNS